MKRLFVVAGNRTDTNAALVSAFGRAGVESSLLRPEQVRDQVRPGDVLLGRVDVLPSLEGVETCLWELRRLERFGARVINGVGALLASHDKLQTALRLGRAGLPHPKTVHLDGKKPLPLLEPPIVLKPRFGSWGRDVVLCESPEAVERELGTLARRRWFRRHGVLAQEACGPPASICGSSSRATRSSARSSDAPRPASGGRTSRSARRAARWCRHPKPVRPRSRQPPPSEPTSSAFNLLPSDTGWVVLELNGAVNFTSDYSLEGRDVFDEVARALTRERQPAALAS